jgi:hypothetical protein
MTIYSKNLPECHITNYDCSVKETFVIVFVAQKQHKTGPKDKKGGKHIVSDKINSHSGKEVSSVQQENNAARKLDGFNPCAAENHFHFNIISNCKRS